MKNNNLTNLFLTIQKNYVFFIFIFNSPVHSTQRCGTCGTNRKTGTNIYHGTCEGEARHVA